MISSIINYMRSFRRLSFRYIYDDGKIVERVSYGIDQNLVSDAVSLDIEGEPGIPSSVVINMFDIPKNVRKVRCRYVKIENITLTTINLHTLIIEHCEILNGDFLHIGQVNHLRLYMSNIELFELLYPERVYTMDIINTGLKRLPSTISRCTFLKSHLNIPYSIATEDERKRPWFAIFFQRADDEFDSYYYTDLKMIIDKYVKKYGNEEAIIADLHPGVMSDMLIIIDKYRERFEETFPLGELVENNIKEFVNNTV